MSRLINGSGLLMSSHDLKRPDSVIMAATSGVAIALKARPALLPAASGSHLTGIATATSQGLRTDRAKRMIETHRRREVLFQRAPTADPQWAEAIIAADPLWGPDEDWKLLIDQTTTQADPPARPPRLNQVDSEEPTTPPTPPDEPEPISAAENHEAELAALEADLQHLFHP